MNFPTTEGFFCCCNLRTSMGMLSLLESQRCVLLLCSYRQVLSLPDFGHRSCHCILPTKTTVGYVVSFTSSDRRTKVDAFLYGKEWDCRDVRHVSLWTNFILKFLSSVECRTRQRKHDLIVLDRVTLRASEISVRFVIPPPIVLILPVVKNKNGRSSDQNSIRDSIETLTIVCASLVNVQSTQCPDGRSTGRISIRRPFPSSLSLFYLIITQDEEESLNRFKFKETPVGSAFGWLCDARTYVLFRMRNIIVS